jgi:hypothetical protein
MAVEPVHVAPERAEGAVFCHRQGGHVTDAAVIQIAVMGVVDRMCAAPDGVGGEGEDTETAPDPILHGPVAQEGAMPAIMLDDEIADQKAPFSMASASANHGLTDSAAHAKTQSARKGTSVTASSNRLRAVEGHGTGRERKPFTGRTVDGRVGQISVISACKQGPVDRRGGDERPAWTKHLRTYGLTRHARFCNCA